MQISKTSILHQTNSAVISLIDVNFDAYIHFQRQCLSERGRYFDKLWHIHGQNYRLIQGHWG